MKYFLGVAPPQELQERIASFQRLWPHNRHPDHVEPHITVKPPQGLASAQEAWLPRVQAACAPAAPVRVRLGRPGWFRRDVVFLGVEASGLHELHDSLLAFFDPATVGPNERPGNYHPHLTLAMRSFGLSAAELAEVHARAAAELRDLPTFVAATVRVYAKEDVGKPWRTLADIPLGGAAKAPGRRV
jgi:2'-5' RNA ligase